MINTVGTNRIVNNVNLKALVKPQKLLTSPISANTTKVVSLAAASAIAAAAMVSTPVSTSEVKEKLKASGFEVNSFKQLSKELTPEEKEKINNRYGEYAQRVRLFYERGINPESDIERFADFINADKDAGRKMFNNNFDRLFETFAILKDNGNLEDIQCKSAQNKEAYKLVTNLVNTDLKPEFLNCIFEWKAKSHKGIAKDALNLLRGNEISVNKEAVQKYIDTLSNGINSQILPKIKLYRREGYEVLKNVKLENGETFNLGEVLKNAAEFPDAENINKVREFVLDNKITAFQNGFMSTSTDYDSTENFTGPQGPDRGEADVIWTLTPKNNTKGIYVEGINSIGAASHEKEVLLNKGSKLEIKNISYDNWLGTWNIEADVSN